MTIAVYEIATGRLVSITDDPQFVANPLPAGLAVKTVNDPPAGYIWDELSLDYVAPPAPRIIAKFEFIQRFTQAEQKEIFGFSFGNSYTSAQQKNMATLMRFLDFVDLIDLDDATVQSGVQYFETVGAIGAGRAAVILA